MDDLNNQNNNQNNNEQSNQIPRFGNQLLNPDLYNENLVPNNNTQQSPVMPGFDNNESANNVAPQSPVMPGFDNNENVNNVAPQSPVMPGFDNNESANNVAPQSAPVMPGFDNNQSANNVAPQSAPVMPGFDNNESANNVAQQNAPATKFDDNIANGNFNQNPTMPGFDNNTYNNNYMNSNQNYDPNSFNNGEFNNNLENSNQFNNNSGFGNDGFNNNFNNSNNFNENNSGFNSNYNGNDSYSMNPDFQNQNNENNNQPNFQNQNEDYNIGFVKNWMGTIYDKAHSKKFNWCAAIFGPLYFLYRKMISTGIVFALIQLLLTAMLSILTLNIKDVSQAGGILAISSVIGLLLAVIFGFAFYPLYRSYVRKQLNKYKQNIPDTNQLMNVASQKGGTSVIAIIIYVVAYSIITIIGTAILTSLGLASFMKTTTKTVQNEVNDVEDNIIDYQEYEFLAPYTLTYDANVWSYDSIKKELVYNLYTLKYANQTVSNIKGQLNIDVNTTDGRASLLKAIVASFTQGAGANSQVEAGNSNFVLMNGVYYSYIDVVINNSITRYYLVLIPNEDIIFEFSLAANDTIIDSEANTLSIEVVTSVSNSGLTNTNSNTIENEISNSISNTTVSNTAMSNTTSANTTLTNSTVSNTVSSNSISNGTSTTNQTNYVDVTNQVTRSNTINSSSDLNTIITH